MRTSGSDCRLQARYQLATNTATLLSATDQQGFYLGNTLTHRTTNLTDNYIVLFRQECETMFAKIRRVITEMLRISQTPFAIFEGFQRHFVAFRASFNFHNQILPFVELSRCMWCGQGESVT